MIQAILFILLISVSIGLPLTLLIAPKHNIVGRLGLSYLLGIGFFTLAMFVTNILGLKFNLLHNILIFIILSLPLIIFSLKQIKNYWKEIITSVKSFHPSKLEKITLGAVLFFVISSFVNTFYWPVYIWDALTMYDFRGKLFAETGFIIKSLQDIGGGYYLGYPLFTSLSHTIVYLIGGNNPQFIYSLFYLSLGLVFYGQLREFVNRKISFLFVLLLLTILQVFNQSTVSYTNLPYTAYFSLGAIYFYIWDKGHTLRDKNETKGYLILSALLIGLSTWVRSTEPFWLAILGLVILFAILKKRYKDILIFSIFFFPIQIMWKQVLTSVATWQTSTLSELTGYSAVLINVFNLNRWGEVVGFLNKNIIYNWGIIFIAFVVGFAYSIVTKNMKETYIIYMICLLLLVMLFVGNFIFSYTFNAWNAIPDSASRMAMFFYPLFIYSIAFAVHK